MYKECHFSIWLQLSNLGFGVTVMFGLKEDGDIPGPTSDCIRLAQPVAYK